PNNGPVTSVSLCGNNTNGCFGYRNWVERYSGEFNGGCVPSGSRRYLGRINPDSVDVLIPPSWIPWDTLPAVGRGSDRSNAVCGAPPSPRRPSTASESSRFEHHGQSLAHADADGRQAPTTAAFPQRVRERAEDTSTRGTQRVPDGDGSTVDVDDLGIELRPIGETSQRLRGERLVQLHRRQVPPADARALQRDLGGLHRTDAEHVRVH